VSKLTVEQKRARMLLRRMKTLVPDADMILEYSNPWELLVAVMLSAQSTDVGVNKVTKTLFKKYRTLDDYVHASRATFEADIRSSGYFRQKARRILTAARIVRDNFQGRVPYTMDEMLTLPGVGRKTANVVLGNAYGVVEGIAVDTHVRRISRRLHLTQHNDPEKIERDLMKLFPKKDWFTLTYYMIEYGRKFSPARKREGGILEQRYGAH